MLESSRVKIRESPDGRVLSNPSILHAASNIGECGEYVTLKVRWPAVWRIEDSRGMFFQSAAVENQFGGGLVNFIDGRTRPGSGRSAPVIVEESQDQNRSFDSSLGHTTGFALFFLVGENSKFPGSWAHTK